MRLKLVVLALAAMVGSSVSADAITGNVPEFKKLADGVFAYIGKQNDANAMVIVTSEGVVLVDTGNNNSDSRALLKNIQAVTKEPLRYVVITQNHGDHIGGTPLTQLTASLRGLGAAELRDQGNIHLQRLEGEIEWLAAALLHYLDQVEAQRP